MSYYRRPVYQKVLIFFNVCFIIAYLLVCLVPFVDTGANWFIAVTGIVFPILFFLLLAFTIVWVFLRSKMVWVCIVTILLGLQQILAVFSFHLPKKFSPVKQSNTLRVLQWNVMGWNQGEERSMIESGGHALRPLMMDAVHSQDADVLCFEEFYESEDTSVLGSNITAIAKIGFPFHYFVRAENEHSDNESGVAIFSRYPIVDTARFSLNRNQKGEHLIYADIKVKDKTFRIFATHLIPIKFADWENRRQISQELYGDAGASTYKRIFSKLTMSASIRYYQSQLAGQKIAQSPYPSIVCGDFNDVPNSGTYFNMKGNLQDAFLKKGSWTGRTTRTDFGIISPSLRIDYILASRNFKVLQFDIIHIPYSDHYPLVTDLKY
jgi:endonuclease/exonuclease/phosphatase family metal-dependent hydrolase